MEIYLHDRVHGNHGLHHVNRLILGSVILGDHPLLHHVPRFQSLSVNRDLLDYVVLWTKTVAGPGSQDDARVARHDELEHAGQKESQAS